MGPARAGASPLLAPLAKPLRQATIALIGTAGISLLGDRPFDHEGERRNPSFGESDLDCVFPLTRLRELEAAREIGRAAPSHYSIMGYQLDTDQLLGRTVPQMIARMRAEAVDAVLLVPV